MTYANWEIYEGEFYRDEYKGYGIKTTQEYIYKGYW